MKKLTVLLMIALTAFILPGKSYGLSCVQFPSMDEIYERYDGIAVGTVEELERGKQRNVVTVRVERLFKGDLGETFKAFEDPTWGAIDGPSEVGESYLFYLKSGKDGKWEHPLCAPTTKTTVAEGALEFLKDKEITITPKPTESSVSLEPGQGGSGAGLNWVYFAVGIGILSAVGMVWWLMRKRNRT